MCRRLIFLISIILVLGLVGNASAVMVGWWNFDDQTLNDSSGLDHHGTIEQGVPATSVTIVYDADRGSYVLDVNTPVLADNTVASWVNCGGGEAGGYADMSTEITIAAWIKVRELHATYMYIVSKDANYQLGLEYREALEAGQFRVYMDDGGGIDPASFLGANPYPLDDDQWHHVALTFDTAGPRRLYMDGFIDIEDDQTGNLLYYYGADDFLIGGREQTTWQELSWNGWIDDVRLYSHALSPVEIKALAEVYTPDTPVPDDGTVDVPLTLGTLGGGISWNSGAKAGGSGDLHKVYFGTVESDVEAGTGGTYRGQFDADSYTGPPLNSLLTAGEQYYWKVTAVNGVEEWASELWSLTTLHTKASKPVPFDGEKYVPTTTARVSWYRGMNANGTSEATGHAVYFGTSKALIDASDPSVYKGDLGPPIVSDPNWAISPPLVGGVTYYWRIDVNFPSFMKNTGNVWSFEAVALSADPNFIAWYKFDETDPSRKVAFDATGNQRHGTIVPGGPGTSLTYIYDAEMDSNVIDCNQPVDTFLNTTVDCGGAWDDPIEPNWPGLIEETSTMATWVKIRSLRVTTYILTYGGRFQFRSLIDPGWTGRVHSYHVDTDTATGVDNMYQFTHRAVDDGQWHHIACTYDSIAHDRRIYLDGELSSVEAAYNSLQEPVTDPFMIAGGYVYKDRGFDGLMDDVRLYNRVLSRDEIHYIGVTDANKAWAPHPHHLMDPVLDWPLTLHWKQGDNTATTQGHKVYFGTDPDLVDACDVSVLLGTYDANNAPTAVGSLRRSETYYWKVNEVNGPTEWQGSTWEFTMEDYMPWDDFESYNSSDKLITDTWIHDTTTGAIVNLGTSGNNDPVHGGDQSMKYEYDNDALTAAYYYSEAYRDFDSPQDWSWATGGVKSLRLYFYGETGNYPDDMYVVLDDGSNEVMKLYDRDSDNLKAGEWRAFDIDLSWFTDGTNDVSLASVDRVYIGFGERGATSIATHLTGTVYFDNFRAYPPHCVPYILTLAGDVSENCIVNDYDIHMMAYRWLEDDYTITPVDPGTGNLVGYWNFDDGTANDSSPGGLHDGTLIQGDTGHTVAIVDDADRGNKVLELDNPLSLLDNLNAVVDCNGHPNDISDPGWAVLEDKVTLATWFKFDDYDRDMYIATKGGMYQLRRYPVREDIDTFMVTLGILTSDTMFTGWSEVDGEWHHVAVTYDRFAGERVVYLDGRVAATDEENDPLEESEIDQGFVIGGRLGTYDEQGFDGRLDEVRLYDDALTQAEVLYLMTGNTTPVYFEPWALANLTDVGDPCESRFVNFKDYNIIADTWLEQIFWPSGW